MWSIQVEKVSFDFYLYSTLLHSFTLLFDKRKKNGTTWMPFIPISFHWTKQMNVSMCNVMYFFFFAFGEIWTAHLAIREIVILCLKQFTRLFFFFLQKMEEEEAECLVLQWFIRNNLLYFVQFRKNRFRKRIYSCFFLLLLLLLFPSIAFLLFFSFVYVCAMSLPAVCCTANYVSGILWKMRTFDGVCNVCFCVKEDEKMYNKTERTNELKSRNEQTHTDKKKKEITGQKANRTVGRE